MLVKIEKIEQLIHLLANRGGIPQPGMRYNWPAFRLARYDIGFVQNISNHLLIKGSTTLTDSQFLLCTKLAKKYKKQLLKSEYDFSEFDWDNPATDCNIIELDRSKKVYIDGDLICIRFRFNADLVNGISELSKCAQGRFEWSKDTKTWIVYPSMCNIKLVVAWASTQNFEIDPAILKICDNILSTPAVKKYMLKDVEGKLDIPDAAPRLQQAIGLLLEEQNLFDLCWNSTLYGYTVDCLIQEQFSHLYRENFTHFNFVKSLVFEKNIHAGDIETVTTSMKELKTFRPQHRYGLCINNASSYLPGPITQEMFSECIDESFLVDAKIVRQEIEKIDQQFDLTVFDSIMYKTGLRRALISQASNKIIIFGKT